MVKHVLSTTIAMLFVVSATLAYGQDLDRGIDLYNTRKYAEAEQTLAQVVANDGENARAYEYLGLARLSLGKFDPAAAALGRAQELSPGSDSIKVGLARVHIEKREFDRADELLKNAREINGDNPDVPLYSGALKLAKRDYEGAIQDLNDAIARKGDNAYAYYYAGLSYSALKRPDKMIDSFQTFLKLAPDAPEAARVRSLLRSVP